MDETPRSAAEHDAARNPSETGEAAEIEASDTAAEAAIEAGWEILRKKWDDPEAHRRFIGLATGLGALPLAGARYRATVEAEPERAEQAQAGIDKILSVALSQMEINRTPTTPPPRRALFLIALLLSLSLVGTALWAYLGG